MRRLNRIFDLGQKDQVAPSPEQGEEIDATAYGGFPPDDIHNDTISSGETSPLGQTPDPDSAPSFTDNLPWRRNSNAAQRAKSIHNRLLRRRIAVGLAGTVGVVVVIGGFWAWTTGRLDVAKFHIQQTVEGSLGNLGLELEEFILEGDRRYTTKNQIRDSLNTSRGEPILAVEPDVLRQRLMTLPWVKEVMVERILPSTIIVTLEERKPLAIWQFQGKQNLLDQSGLPIDVKDLDPFEDLPVLVGAKADAFAVDFIHMVQQVDRISKKLKVAQLVNQRRWTLKLNNDILIHLPEENALQALIRVANLDKIDSLLSRDVLEIDLRLADRIVVRTNSGSDRTINNGISSDLGAPT